MSRTNLPDKHHNQNVLYRNNNEADFTDRSTKIQNYNFESVPNKHRLPVLIMFLLSWPYLTLKQLVIDFSFAVSQRVVQYFKSFKSFYGFKSEFLQGSLQPLESTTLEFVQVAYQHTFKWLPKSLQNILFGFLKLPFKILVSSLFKPSIFMINSSLKIILFLLKKIVSFFSGLLDKFRSFFFFIKDLNLKILYFFLSIFFQEQFLKSVQDVLQQELDFSMILWECWWFRYEKGLKDDILKLPRRILLFMVRLLKEFVIEIHSIRRNLSSFFYAVLFPFVLILRFFYKLIFH
ncbi:hypothetical protein M0812_14456 [Anaeramoeba flamelloides]|uniref:Uncharacterized protein n=1 Tax=Anaeramoeba flamelloides TaxID=1746091 RepID=A0AAV7ZFH2_9EUKA|nr:hypothetical protein M0812_14456 [Anaeramoeba flamelloides]